MSKELTMTQYELPTLPYALNALEPVINEETMNRHYNFHHKAYVTNLNKAIEQYAEAENKQDPAGMIAAGNAIKFNGGGHINHSIFWTNLAPINQGGGKPPQGKLAEAINQTFGSFQKFCEIMSAKAIAIQGSGWAWLGYRKETKQLEIVTCENQDPLSTKGLIPLLGIDVWEHAYYLKYKNARPEYVNEIWKVVNWANVEERFAAAAK